MANKIINNGDWYLVEIIEKYEPIATDKTKELRRVTTYGNYHLINATTPSQAYDKAVKIGKTSNYKFTNSHKLKMKSEFLGIGDLLPIHDNLEDGAEIMWTNYGFISAKNSEKKVRSKKELINFLKPKSV
jgi:hypothetical protein